MNAFRPFLNISKRMSRLPPCSNPVIASQYRHPSETTNDEVSESIENISFMPGNDKISWKNTTTSWNGSPEDLASEPPFDDNSKSLSTTGTIKLLDPILYPPTQREKGFPKWDFPNVEYEIEVPQCSDNEGLYVQSQEKIQQAGTVGEGAAFSVDRLRDKAGGSVKDVKALRNDVVKVRRDIRLANYMEYEER